jgi:hypothetical protein
MKKNISFYKKLVFIKKWLIVFDNFLQKVNKKLVLITFSKKVSF